MYMNKIFMEWLQSLVEAVIIVTFLFVFCWPLKIDGRSMESTFFSGDRVLISRISALFGDVKNSDIIVCNIVEDGKQHSILKRAIAVPNDKIRIENGLVYINNILLDENYVSVNVDFNLQETVLGENKFFVMGDNRELSYDSRYMGVVDKDQIVGKVLLKWFPFGEIKLF